MDFNSNFNSYIFATEWWKLLTFQTLTSNKPSKIHGLKNKSTASGCNDVRIREFKIQAVSFVCLFKVPKFIKLSWNCEKSPCIQVISKFSKNHKNPNISCLNLNKPSQNLSKFGIKYLKNQPELLRRLFHIVVCQGYPRIYSRHLHLCTFINIFMIWGRI